MSAPARPALLTAAVLFASSVLAERPAFDVEALEVPAASGSRSPNLAAGGDRLVLSWIEPANGGHRLRYSVLAGERWSEPRTVATGDNWFVNWADFPSVVPIDESLWAAHWLVRQPAGGYAYDVHLSVSKDGGRNWSESMLPHDDGTPTEHGFVTLFPHHGLGERGLGLIWLDGRNTAEASHGASGGAMTLRYATFSADLDGRTNTEIDGFVCDCCQTDVALAEAGPVAVYRNRTEDEVRDVYVMRRVDGAWQPGEPVADDHWVIGGCPVNGPTISANGRQLAVAWFTGADDQPRVRLVTSSDDGATFSAPIDIDEGRTLGRVGVAWLSDNRVAVSWLCEPAESARAVCLREVVDGRAGPVQVVSGADPVPPLNVPQLARHGDGLVAAWTAETDGRTTIRAARIRESAD